MDELLRQRGSSLRDSRCYGDLVAVEVVILGSRGRSRSSSVRGKRDVGIVK